MGRFDHLLAPGQIGSMTLRNRILMCPMGDSLCESDGTISPNQAAYFEARARGGAALLLVGSVSIAYPRASFDARQVAASDDRYIPGLADLADRVHRHGGRIAAQLVHNGQLALFDVTHGVPLVVPSIPKPANPDRYWAMVTLSEMAAMTSPFTQPTSKLEYHAATEGDIADVIVQFVDAADRCMRAGFDGIELHAGHGYLIDEFLTPSMNTRSDGWGGGIEGRARLLVEIVRALRARFGSELPLWIRINAVERHKTHGERFEDQLQAIMLAGAAGLDAVHLTAYHDTDVATGPTDSYAPHDYVRGAPGSLTEYAREVKAKVDIPVITFGRMEPEEAEQVLSEGKADFIAMGRKLLADPDLPNKLAEDRVDDIRPCIYQYRCIGNIFVKESLHCVANAFTGREHDFAIPASTTPRRVLVIGGGPGGLEAARLLAAVGHHVTLWEKDVELGGMLRHAGGADPLLARYLRWLTGQVEKAGVAFEVGRPATADAVQAEGADAVVLATGAAWGVNHEVPGADRAHVLSVPALSPWLSGDDSQLVGSRVVLLGGGKASVSIAHLAVLRGRQVSIIAPTNVFCEELGLPGRWRLVPDIERAGVQLVANATVEEVTAGAVRVRTGDSVLEVPADTVISTADVTPDTALAAELTAAGVSFHAVGDCNGVRHIEGANLDAVAVALALAT